MKIIDLLNKIANGEEVPKKIKYNGIIYYKKRNVYKHTNYYESENNNLLIANIQNSNQLNDLVKIIEEENKIPEKLGKIEDNDGYIDQYDVIKIGKKVDEIIDYLKSKGDK